MLFNAQSTSSHEVSNFIRSIYVNNIELCKHIMHLVLVSMEFILELWMVRTKILESDKFFNIGMSTITAQALWSIFSRSAVWYGTYELFENCSKIEMRTVHCLLIFLFIWTIFILHSSSYCKLRDMGICLLDKGLRPGFLCQETVG